MSLPVEFKNKLKAVAPKKPARTGPLWEGPESSGPNGGVTQSMLGRFLSCRERFRLNVIEGLRPQDTFSHKLEFGSMWHACEEALAKEEGEENWGDWEAALQSYTSKLCRRYPLAQEQVNHWYEVVKLTFPRYVEYWSKHKDVVARTPLLQEAVFDVPYLLPSGRTVRLRGKWDGVDLIGRGKTAGIWLFETKTKGDIREEQLRRQLSFDLQTMTYIVALQDYARNNSLRDMARKAGAGASVLILGVRYNVIRRPLSGGKGSIVRHKPSKSNPQGESKEDYYKRVGAYIDETPETYFMRWSVTITPKDIETFRRQFLDPILEQLCEWYQWVKHTSLDPFRPGTPEGIKAGVVHGRWGIHWRHPFGGFNILDEGGSSDLDAYLENGSEVGLTRVGSMFDELK